MARAGKRACRPERRIPQRRAILDRVTRAYIPDEILAAAHARARAREARDWAEADRLRAQIEAAGFRVVDRGTDFALSPARAPDVAEGERVRFGSSTSVASRLEEPPQGGASVVVVATDHPADVDRAIAGVVAHAAVPTQVVVVGDGPSAEQDAALDELERASASEAAETPEVDIEVVRLATRLGHAAALNAGIRRAAADVVIVLDASIEPAGDIVTPLLGGLEDTSVAVAGPFGLVTADLRQFEEAPAGDVDAIAGYCLAFRRADFVERGPLDEHFRFYRNLDIWWSLVLRDEGPDAAARRALALADVPIVRHEHRGWIETDEVERVRLSRRNFYRVLDRFRGRLDLLTRRVPG